MAAALLPPFSWHASRLLLGLVCLLGCGAQAQSNLSLPQIYRLGAFDRLACSQAVGPFCQGRTPLPPNALAQVLRLAAPNPTRDGWSTGGRGWTLSMTEQYGSWQVFLSPLGRTLSASELQQFPAPPPTTLGVF